MLSGPGGVLKDFPVLSAGISGPRDATALLHARLSPPLSEQRGRSRHHNEHGCHRGLRHPEQRSPASGPGTASACSASATRTPSNYMLADAYHSPAEQPWRFRALFHTAWRQILAALAGTCDGWALRSRGTTAKRGWRASDGISTRHTWTECAPSTPRRSTPSRRGNAVFRSSRTSPKPRVGTDGTASACWVRRRLVGIPC